MVTATGRRLAAAVFALALTFGVFGKAWSQTTVVTFDDLSGSGNLTGIYGGIDWRNNWSHYEFSQPPYNPQSDPTRIHTNYDNGWSAGDVDSVPFYFLSPVRFDGAYLSGFDFSQVSFEMYLGGSLVSTSSVLGPSGTPSFLGSGYLGLVDEVRVHGSNGFYVMDDVTYTATAPIPEPETYAMMLAGLAVLVATTRRRRQKEAAAT